MKVRLSGTQDSGYFVTHEVGRELPVDAFVEQNGADGISDIEGKVARIAASELGNERVSMFTRRAQADSPSLLQEMQ